MLTEIKERDLRDEEEFDFNKCGVFATKLSPGADFILLAFHDLKQSTCSFWISAKAVLGMLLLFFKPY